MQNEETENSKRPVLSIVKPLRIIVGTVLIFFIIANYIIQWSRKPTHEVTHIFSSPIHDTVYLKTEVTLKADSLRLPIQMEYESQQKNNESELKQRTNYRMEEDHNNSGRKMTDNFIRDEALSYPVFTNNKKEYRFKMDGEWTLSNSYGEPAYTLDEAVRNLSAVRYPPIEDEYIFAANNKDDLISQTGSFVRIKARCAEPSN
jgi:hypothetical protein